MQTMREIQNEIFALDNEMEAEGWEYMGSGLKEKPEWGNRIIREIPCGKEIFYTESCLRFDMFTIWCK